MKRHVTGCHSAVDAESGFSFFWILPFLLGEPAEAGAGITIFRVKTTTLKRS